MPPPTRADRPEVRPHTAKQMIAATTVTETWPSTTLIASRLAWGNSRVTTTLLPASRQSAYKTSPRCRRQKTQLCTKIVLACNDLRCLGQGARIIYADPHAFNTKSCGKRAI